tara:strand:+ start:3819 stop:4928 length:1110 start_codon:yes stop_codon:yes gene_type:complete
MKLFLKVTIVFLVFNAYSSDLIDKLNLPTGFDIEIYASDINSPRQIAQSNEGTIFVGSKNGDSIIALVDRNQDGYAESKIIVADKLQNPTGVVFQNKDLYFSEIDKIWKITNIDEWISMKSKTLPKKDLIFDDLPSDRWHGFKYIDFGPDGDLYIPVGVPCNICLEPQKKDPRYAAIHKISDGKLVTVAEGVRNSVGFDWHPVTKKMYFSDNGRDWLGDDSPSCELNIIEKEGSFYGYPFKHAKNVIDPKFGDLIESVDKEFIDPIAELGPHVAPLGITFYDAKNFPEKYHNGIFIALHGSWNRTKRSGYKVIFVNLDKEGNFLYQEDFITGWLQDENAWGRPVSPFVMHDGSLLISDDKHNVLYRVTY